MRGASKLSFLLVLPLVGACTTDEPGLEEQGDDSSSESTSESETGEDPSESETGEDPCVELSDGGDESPVMLRSCEPHEQDPQLDLAQTEALAAGSLDFGLELYHALRDDQAEDQGFAISPHSLRLVFAMLYGGAVDPARSEIASAMAFTLADEQHAAFNWLDAQLDARNLAAGDDADPVIVEAANRVWTLDALAELIAPSYLDLLALHYDVGVFLADFANQPEVERDKINAWVDERTNGLIPELFAPGIISPSSELVLVNTLYLKAPWATPFDAEDTSTASFTRLDGSSVDVEMMFSSGMAAALAFGDDWEAVAVPLRGDALELVVIVPADFEAFEASLDADTLAAIFAETEGAGDNIVALSLPRFQLESDFQLQSELMALGMVSPFTDPGSFEAIVSGHPMVIQTVVHKTVLEVQEGGVEAAAASGVVVGPPSLPEELVVDRPFLLGIRDRPTDTLLFFGRVLDPTAN